MNRPTEREFSVGQFLNLAKAVGVSIEELEMIDYSTLMDMVVEKSNDAHDWKELATQEDFDRF